jgi:hypothetical protein
MNERLSEFVASERRVGVRREVWLLWALPKGDRLIIYFEADDVMEALNGLAASNDPFDVWCKDQLKLATGEDFSEPSVGPLPEQILSFS